MTFTFVTWSQRKGYAMLSQARNAGLTVSRADIPMYVEHKDGTRTPYKSIVELECGEPQWREMLDEVYRQEALRPSEDA